MPIWHLKFGGGHPAPDVACLAAWGNVKTLTDYEGKAIRLTDERPAHILEHPEMRGMEGRIEETVRQPESVLESVSDPQARLYYRRYPGTQVGDKHLLRVFRSVRFRSTSIVRFSGSAGKAA